MIVRTSFCAAVVALALSVAASTTACHSAPPPPPPPPRALSDSASAALRWVQSHAAQFSMSDSVMGAAERSRLIAMVGNARVIGVSELSEGTHEFPYLVRRMLFALADSAGVRGLSLQAPMPEMMELDRYVRTGAGDPRRIMHTLGSWRWETREMFALVEAIREWNRGRSAGQQIGLSGFEIPTAAHAVQVVTSLPDSVAGAGLHAWLRREYACVTTSEDAHWGLEGRAQDSTYWNQCGTVAAHALDSVVALHRRVSASSPSAASVAFAEQMARLIEHHVRIGLRHLPRHQANAEHVLFLANLLGSDTKLLVWGGDQEMGRLPPENNVVQTAVALGERLGARFRTIAFMFGDGAVRASRPASGRGTQPSGLGDVAVRSPLPETYEDVLNRVAADAYWLDVSTFPSDNAGGWLRGPHPARLIIELYAPQVAELFQVTLEFPKTFDGVLFVRHVTAAHQ